MNFSVVLIARNEEKTLPRLLVSLEGFKAAGGAVILVDTGSKDKTADVARDWGCMVTEVGDRFRIHIDKEMADAINGRFCVDGEKDLVSEGDSLFDYASARNFAASLSPTDMVAMPDCDEVYTHLQLDKIQGAIMEGTQQFEYPFVFSHDEHGNEAIKFMHSKFYDRTRMHWVGIIHEVLSATAPVNARRCAEETIKLEHFQNRETDRSGYLRGLALDCYLHPDNDRNSHYLGREMLWTGRPKSALKELARHVEMDRWPAERSQSLIFMGDAYRMLGDDAAAIAHWERAQQVEPNRREALMRLAQYHYEKENRNEVIRYVTEALKVPHAEFYADNQADYRERPHEMLYWAFWGVGKFEEAKAHWLKCYELVPQKRKYLDDAHFFVELPTVSFIIPHLGRQDGLKRVVASINRQKYDMTKLEILVDPRPEPTVPEKVKALTARATGQYVFFASNDIELEPDCLLQAVLASKLQGKGLVAVNTGDVSPDEGNICEHFLLDKRILPKIGDEIFDTEFVHVGCDNLLWAKAKLKGEATRSEHAKATHYHFSRGSEYDWVYERGWKHAERDRELLEKKLAKLYRHVWPENAASAATT